VERGVVYVRCDAIDPLLPRVIILDHTKMAVDAHNLDVRGLLLFVEDNLRIKQVTRQGLRASQEADKTGRGSNGAAGAAGDDEDEETGRGSNGAAGAAGAAGDDEGEETGRSSNGEEEAMLSSQDSEIGWGDNEDEGKGGGRVRKHFLMINCLISLQVWLPSWYSSLNLSVQ
jgi:hypothetical protein